MLSKRSVCYLTFDSLNEGVGQSQVVPLIKGIASQGFEVTVVSFEKSKFVETATDFDKLNIRWIQLPFGAQGLKGLPKRIFLMAKNLPKADIYHVRSDLPVIALALRGKRNFLWDVRSLWFDQKVIVDGKKPFKIISNAARRLEKFSATNASAVNTLAEPLLTVLEQRNGHIPRIQTVIPTCVDTSKFLFNPKINTERLILLSGTLNNFYDLERTRRILQLLAAGGFQVEWAKGNESRQESLQEPYIKQVTLKHSDMPSKIAQSSFGIAICRTDSPEILKGVMPTKVAEFFSVGRPVIVSPGMGDLDRLVREYNVGIILEEDETESDVLKQTLDLLRDEKLPMRCRKLAEDHFSMQSAIARYIETYQAM